jgi:hypothetical protein
MRRRQQNPIPHRAPHCCALLWQNYTSTLTPLSQKIEARALGQELYNRWRQFNSTNMSKMSSKCFKVPAEQVPLPFFSNLPQKIVICGMAILRRLRYTVEIKRIAVFVLIYFPIFGQRCLLWHEAVQAQADMQ